MTSTVSEIELAALIASLSGEPAPGGARCPVTELIADQCAHCRPEQPALDDTSTLGPWFTATYRGKCARCGGSFDEFEQIRADSEGGWLAACCGGPREQTTTGGIIAPPATLVALPATLVVPAGPPPSTIRELRTVLMDFEASRPRTMQTNLGPSELGTPCQAQIARKLAGCPRRPVTEPTWAPFQGTAVHASMEKVVAFWNAQAGRERWLAEDRLQVDPGMDGVDPIEGSGDAFDLDHGMVVDWKHTGTTALDKLRRGKRMGKPTDQQVSAEYRVQAHLYGMGHERKGRDVRYVRLVLLARSWKYDDSAEWTEPYDPTVAIGAVTRYYATHDLLAALDVASVPDLIGAVPTTPHRDTCRWCPFLRPGQPNDWHGCPGDKPLDRIVERATDGLIAPTAKETL